MTDRPSGEGDVVLPRKQVRGLYRAVVAFLAAVVVLSAPLAYLAWEQADTNRHQAETDRRLEAVILSEQADERLEEARECVRAWDVLAEIRESDVVHNQAAAEALIEVVQPDDQAIVDLYRAVLARRLEGASELIEDPACDLGHAQRVVAEAQTPSTQPEE